jgi:hypothetical protein
VQITAHIVEQPLTAPKRMGKPYRMSDPVAIAALREHCGIHHRPHTADAFSESDGSHNEVRSIEI